MENQNEMKEVHFPYKTEQNNEDSKLSICSILLTYLPVTANYFLYFFINFIETHFLGKLNDLNIYDGVGLGITYNLFFMFIGYGMVESLTIIIPRQFGNKNYREVSNNTKQVAIIVNIFFILYAIFSYFFSLKILSFFGNTNSSYISYAHQYVLYTIPRFILEINCEILEKFSESQLYFTPVTVSIIIAGLTHLIGCYFFIQYFNLGVIGVSLAINLTCMIKLLYLIMHIIVYNPLPMSLSWDLDGIFDNFPYILKLVLTTTANIFTQYNFSVISQIVANRTNKIDYAKYIVLYNSRFVIFSFSAGCGNTIGILISKYIGENSTEKIKEAIMKVLTIGGSIQIFMLIFLYFTRYKFFYFFNTNTIISNSRDMVESYIFVLLLENILDFIQTFMAFILRSCEVFQIESVFLFLMILILHAFNSPFLTFYFNFGITGVLLGDCFIWTFLSLCWLVYMVLKLDLENVCNNYMKQQKKVELKPEEIEIFISESVSTVPE
jgi:Na+-driven multidrug efflux pump